jgi:hypothetical protein
MSVAGIDKFGSKHADYLTVMPGGNVTDAISLYGGFKGAGWVMPQYNKTRVGVQRRPTWLNYFQGPETSITVSELGSCSVNVIDGPCISANCRQSLQWIVLVEWSCTCSRATAHH